jgi:hypothetical protein
VLIFVNSFSFIFMEFLARIYWAKFFSWAKNAKKGCTREKGPDRPLELGGLAGPVRPAQGGPAAVRLVFSPECSFSTFFFGQKNFKGSLNKENVVSRVFLFGLFIWPNWELGNPSHVAFFSTHATTMVSAKSVESKQGAKEPSMEEAK